MGCRHPLVPHLSFASEYSHHQYPCSHTPAYPRPTSGAYFPLFLGVFHLLVCESGCKIFESFLGRSWWGPWGTEGKPTSGSPQMLKMGRPNGVQCPLEGGGSVGACSGPASVLLSVSWDVGVAASPWRQSRATPCWNLCRCLRWCACCVPCVCCVWDILTVPLACGSTLHLGAAICVN